MSKKRENKKKRGEINMVICCPLRGVDPDKIHNKMGTKAPELANKKGANMNSVILTVCLADEQVKHT